MIKQAGILAVALISVVVWPIGVIAQEVDVKIEVIANTTDRDSAELDNIVVAMVPKLKKYKSINRRIVQSNKQFIPFITVAQLGSEVELPNEDNVSHHVYSFSKALTFDLPLYSREQKRSLQIDSPGIIAIGCNIHDWMLGFIVVVDTPYFTFAKDKTGEFENLPEGEYELIVWHPSMRDLWLQPVSVSAANPFLTVLLPFALEPVVPLPTPDSEDLDMEDY